MNDALENDMGSVSIGGRIITNLHFTDDIVVNDEEEEEADYIVTSVDTACTVYKMETGHDKTKILAINPYGFQRVIKMKGRRLEDVKSFKYLE